MPGSEEKAREEMIRTIPFLVDNRRCTMADALCGLLKLYKPKAIDIATPAFSVEGWQLVAEELSKVENVHLLLGSEPELNVGAEAGDENAQRLVEDFTNFLFRKGVHVRFYTGGVLNAGCAVLFSNSSRYDAHAAIAGTSALTRAGLLTNVELNFVLHADLLARNISTEQILGQLKVADPQILGRWLTPSFESIAASLPGVLAIHEIALMFSNLFNKKGLVHYRAKGSQRIFSVSEKTEEIR